MNLPNIRFNISKNGLGLATAEIQKIPGIVLTGVTVSGANKVTTGVAYQIFSLEEAENLGIEATGANAFAHKHLAAFYEKTGKGAELWFMVVPAVVTLTEMADLTNPYAKKLLSDAKGKIRVLGFVKKSGSGETITEGLDADVHTAAVKAQELANDFADRYFPVRTIISGNKFSGVVADLKDYATTELNRVSILLANNDGSKEASIGMYLGRTATIPSQRKVSRVKDGAVEPLAAYFTSGDTVESLDTAWDAIANKNYIFLRGFANRSGYWFTGDQTLTLPTDDFRIQSRGLVMDEAVLIAYDTMVEELSDEIPVTELGTVHPAIIKGWQNKIEKNLNRNMVQVGKLSAVKAFIDQNQDVLTSDNLDIDLQLLPVGYSDFITIKIGFTTKLD
ncbi:DUF2586 family protein [Flavobacterium covae]|uniref:DUF2586 family protein n=1 Tax=Flavobacterium covae TaxID=2906076 RepID=UPI000745CE9A|nr:DUF2586 family protein [Flavobacterium covae]AMA48988.1 hypothetical protein AWN65_05675 [Flavobacterium covae]MCJ1809907.1 DUF2586 family protein [Flavobacterium covae]